MDWKTKRVLVTGGASFIGSTLIDGLFTRGATEVRVVDDMSSGTVDNLRVHLDAGRIDLVNANLLTPGVAESSVDGIDVVFHLAAIHGGRGYVDLHQAECAKNLALDGNLIRAAVEGGIEKFDYASSGCVYPMLLQSNVDNVLYLTEDMVGPPSAPDGMYD